MVCTEWLLACSSRIVYECRPYNQVFYVLPVESILGKLLSYQLAIQERFHTFQSGGTSLFAYHWHVSHSLHAYQIDYHILRILHIMHIQHISYVCRKWFFAGYKLSDDEDQDDQHVSLCSDSTLMILFAKLAAIHHVCVALFKKLTNNYQEDPILFTTNVQE